MYVMTGGKNNIPINLKINKDSVSTFECPIGEKFVCITYYFGVRIVSTSFKNI